MIKHYYIYLDTHTIIHTYICKQIWAKSSYVDYFKIKIKSPK